MTGAKYDLGFVLDERGEIDSWVFMPTDGSPSIEVPMVGGVNFFLKSLRKKGLKSVADSIESDLRRSLRDGMITGFDDEGWPVYAPLRP